ncbi:metallophosphoesterase [Plantactinospora sp. WMMB334]|uniref:metallophosphoesterase n=1 Tax=Plantactinospora sp. WMMB334 TaxID=3404119 RepID=UPI003B93088A
MSASEAAPAVPVAPARRFLRSLLFGLTLTGVLALLFGVPWWTLVGAGTHWPTPVFAAGTALFILALAALPVLMYVGHGRQRDWAARTGDTLLGVVWVLFAWAALGNVLRAGLAVGGVADPARSRIAATAVAAVSVVLLAWGYVEAMRLPRVRRLDVPIGRLGAGLDGVRIVLLTDTHYGPIDRAGWSARVVAAVNDLDADIVCHTGDIADGSVTQRRGQTAPLGGVRARLARAYVTGNHEYFGEAQGWLDHMRDLGWEPLHNGTSCSNGTAPGSCWPVSTTPRPVPRGAPGTGPTMPRPSPAPTPSCRSCSSPISRSRSPVPWRTVSTCNSPGTPTAGRSGRSTSWSGWTSRRCGG